VRDKESSTDRLQQLASQREITSIGRDRVSNTKNSQRLANRRENTSDVLLVDEEKEPKDKLLHCKDNQLMRVSKLHGAYNPLQYPLMFVKGEDKIFYIKL